MEFTIPPLKSAPILLLFNHYKMAEAMLGQFTALSIKKVQKWKDGGVRGETEASLL